jgi:DNA-directed RNA polymerase specialized sigma24 family protein
MNSALPQGPSTRASQPVSRPRTITQADATADTATRNAFILESLHQATPMLRKLATRLGYAYEELYQMAALVALERYARSLETSHPRKYLHACMRYAIMDHYWKTIHRSLHAVSLDKPIDEEGRITYADLLASPDTVARVSEQEKSRTAALYGALSRLPLEEQSYLCRVYGICDYTPDLPTEGRFAGRLPDDRRSDAALSSHAYNWLRRDTALARALAPEVARFEKGCAPMGYSARYAFEEDMEEIADFPRLSASSEQETPTETSQGDVLTIDSQDECATDPVQTM